MRAGKLLEPSLTVVEDLPQCFGVYRWLRLTGAAQVEDLLLVRRKVLLIQPAGLVLEHLRQMVGLARRADEPRFRDANVLVLDQAGKSLRVTAPLKRAQFPVD